jgi:hypothetical protein
MAKAPRPGTSLSRPLSNAGVGGINQSMRPMSAANRPLTGPPPEPHPFKPLFRDSNSYLGFARPGTQSRLGTASRGAGNLSQQLQVPHYTLFALFAPCFSLVWPCFALISHSIAPRHGIPRSWQDYSAATGASNGFSVPE